jgi:hypothetical protein
MTIPNHDWATRLAEPTTETIQAELNGTVLTYLNPKVARRLEGTAMMSQLNHTQTAALHILVRRVVALELEKLEHKFSARHDAIAPGNAAHWIAERAREIRAWTPTWCVVTGYQDGAEDEQPFETLDEALYDLATVIKGTTKKLRMR